MSWTTDRDDFDDEADQLYLERQREWAAGRQEREAAAERDSVHAWFLRRVDVLAGWNGQTFRQQQRTSQCEAKVTAGLEWYWEHRQHFLHWKDYEEHGGDGNRSGRWVIDANAVQAARASAIRAYYSPAAELDWILSCLVQYPDFLPPPIPEPAAVVLVTSQARFYDQRHRVRVRWPRPCAACGQEFRPARNGRTRCDACRATGKPAPRQRKGATS